MNNIIEMLMRGFLILLLLLPLGLKGVEVKKPKKVDSFIDRNGDGINDILKVERTKLFEDFVDYLNKKDRGRGGEFLIKQQKGGLKKKEVNYEVQWEGSRIVSVAPLSNRAVSTCGGQLQQCFCD